MMMTMAAAPVAISGLSARPAGQPAQRTVSDRSAEALFVAHFPSLCRTAFLVVGDRDVAEELVMEAFSLVLARWEAVERADQPIASLRRAVVNVCLSRLRRLVLERRGRAAKPTADSAR